jgi:hypothetical protein
VRYSSITTDGFDFYERVIGQIFGPACVYGQVMKTRRNNRIVKVERRGLIGTEGRLEEGLQRSEDSSTVNRKAADVTGDLLFGNGLFVNVPDRACVPLLCNIILC